MKNVAGTKEGALKGKLTNELKYGKDYYKNIGSKSWKNPNRSRKTGFALIPKEKVVEYAKVGGSRKKSDYHKLVPVGNTFAKVSIEDYEYISSMGPWYLSSTGYAVRRPIINGKKTTVRMHRVINDTIEGLDTDHINHDKLDNRRSNLRSVNRSENIKNASVKNWGPARINSQKTHCKLGHEFNEENTLIYNGKRNCKICRNKRQNEKRHQTKEEYKQEEPVYYTAEELTAILEAGELSPGVSE
jgi:hypothetical protein